MKALKLIEKRYFNQRKNSISVLIPTHLCLESVHWRVRKDYSERKVNWFFPFGILHGKITSLKKFHFQIIQMETD